ncbi:MAG TPA: prepilin peptidase, partial [Sphingorhabdus sp.]|nr:prepilin peptidase [Sphingorhabdus sp.]
MNDFHEHVGTFIAALPMWFFVASVTMFGAIWGSFVAAMTARWGRGESIAGRRSYCEQCFGQIANRDLVPMISYLLLKGRCRNCGQKLGRRHLAIEAGSALLAAFAALTLQPAEALALALFAWLLLPLIILDYEHLWLPDRLVLLLAAGAILVSPLLTPDIAWSERVIGAAAGFASLETIRR